MGKITGFMEFERAVEPYRPVSKRLSDYREIFSEPHNIQHLQQQGARCMDCGVPFCQSDTGCPVDNLIPEWNDLVYRNQWKEALVRLHKTNNFPEFTGRVCPAPCEGACVLAINQPAVTIKNIEQAIADRGFEEGWVVPHIVEHRSGKKVAVIGSGPAGLAAAAELNKMGHSVQVFERSDRIGGLLMYGIPNMKLDKFLVERRVGLLKNEGVEFIMNFDVGKTARIDDLKQDFDAILLATGATRARDLAIENRDAAGVHLAMDYLTDATKNLLDKKPPAELEISAKDKRVIVIGGGDTGTDCIATALRQGAKSIVNFELMAKPPDRRAANNPWPEWPLIYRVDYGHEEAAAVFGSDPRNYNIITKKFIKNKNGGLDGVMTANVDFADGKMVERPDSEKLWRAELVLLAMGFVAPEHYSCGGSDVDFDERGNYRSDYGDFQTSEKGVFAAGDCRRGQSLVVWAIHEGRLAADKIDAYLATVSA